MNSPSLLIFRTSSINNLPFFLAMPKLFRIFAIENLIFLASITLEINHFVLLQVNLHMNKSPTTIIYHRNIFLK